MQPSFISDGTTPRRTDSRWFRWLKILGAYQNQSGSDPSNNPKRSDSLRTLQYKVNRATAGTDETCVMVSGAGTLEVNGQYDFVTGSISFGGVTVNEYYQFGDYRIANLVGFDPDMPWVMWNDNSGLGLYSNSALTGLWGGIIDGQNPNPSVSNC